MNRSCAMQWIPLAVAVLSIVSAAVARQPSRPPVFADLTPEEAIAANVDSDRILIVKATATWCAPCKRMDATTWRDERIEAWFAAHGVAVELDIDKNAETSVRLGIRSVPTMIAYRKGKQFDRLGGFREAPEFLRWLEDVRGDQRGGDRRNRLIDEKLSRKNSLDMSARLELARELVAADRMDAAVNEYVWLWNNIAKRESSMGGVRVSFMSADMQRLAKGSPKAMEEFRKLRDAAANQIANPPKRSGLMNILSPRPRNEDARLDWIVLNEVIGDDDETIEWFRDAIRDPVQRRAALALGYRLKYVLISKGAWAEVAQLIPDPLVELRSAIAFREMDRSTSSRADDPEVYRIAQRTYRHRAAEIYAAMLAAGREQDASVLAEAAMENELQDRSAMRCALITQALKAEQPRPVHFDWIGELTCSDAPDLKRQLEGWLGVAPRP